VAIIYGTGLIAYLTHRRILRSCNLDKRSQAKKLVVVSDWMAFQTSKASHGCNSVHIFPPRQWEHITEVLKDAMINGDAKAEYIENMWNIFQDLELSNTPGKATNLILTVRDLSTIVSQFSNSLSFVELMTLI
jgi:hypothetical protein